MANPSIVEAQEAANPHADPPDGSPYQDIPAALRATLEASFADRLAGVPGSTQNLMFGFPPAPRPPPRTVWEALDNLSMMAVNLLVRLFTRIHDIDPTHALWKQIRWIRNQWWGGSAGVKVVYRDPAEMRACLDGLLTSTTGHAAARDTYLGAMEHQLSPMKALLEGLVLHPSKIHDPPPDCDTWREVYTLGEESVHFCVGKEDLAASPAAQESSAPRRPESDDVHIDWMSPVKGIDPATHRCDYDWGVSLLHWKQATDGEGAPLFTFSLIDSTLDASLTLASGRADAGDRMRKFAERWRAVEKQLAVHGKPGYDRSLDHCHEYMEIIAALDPDWADREPYRLLAGKRPLAPPLQFA